MDYLQRIVNQSEAICLRLKQKRFPKEDWSKAVTKVAALLTQMKKTCRRLLNTTDDLKILAELVRYTDSDMAELLELSTGKEALEASIGVDAFKAFICHDSNNG